MIIVIFIIFFFFVIPPKIMSYIIIIIYRDIVILFNIKIIPFFSYKSFYSISSNIYNFIFFKKLFDYLLDSYSKFMS